VDTLVESFSEAAGTIGRNPKKAALVFAYSAIASTCELICFCLVGLAFGLSAPSALVGGYVVATLFAMISITPQGVGVVEVAVVTLLAAYGISTAAGTAIALVYRGLVFWMPFAIGAVLIHRTKSFARDDAPPRRLKRGEHSADEQHRLKEGQPSSLLPTAKPAPAPEQQPKSDAGPKAKQPCDTSMDNKA
jgi:hypothetical protein